MLKSFILIRKIQQLLHISTLDYLPQFLFNFHQSQIYKKRSNIYLKWEKKNPDRSYKEFYSEFVNIKAVTDPKAAVGGKWEEIGNFQFNFLLQHRLKKHHKLLDIGCGCLRGGLHFIRYLNESNYYGVDISKGILEAGKKFLYESKLEHKSPVLKINTNLKFNNFQGEVFDFILAQSVFTHMPLRDIDECFKNIHKVMHNKTIFFATFWIGDKCFTPDDMNFYYPFNILRNIGKKNKLDVILIEDFAHPRNQKMMKITLK